MQKHTARTELMKVKLTDRIDELDAYLGGDLDRASMRDRYSLYLLKLALHALPSMSDKEAVKVLTDIENGKLWDTWGQALSFHDFCDDDGAPLLVMMLAGH